MLALSLVIAIFLAVSALSAGTISEALSPGGGCSQHATPGLAGWGPGAAEASLQKLKSQGVEPTGL